MDLVGKVIDSTAEYIEKMPKTIRKGYGQFFTSKETAVFMASLFSIPTDKERISILDPGTGSGILSVALIERLIEHNIKSILLVCYENDSNIIELLEKNLSYVKSHIDIDFSYQIKNDNYIISQASDYNLMLDANPNPQKYDNRKSPIQKNSQRRF